MKYQLDTEFFARPFTIDLIIIGLVAEDGRELYAERSETDGYKASPWTLENVRQQLDGNGMSREYLGYALRNFTDADEHPVFWGYFPAYDWVAFVGLFGALEELPFHFPQLYLDIKHGRSSLATPSFRIRREAATTRSLTPAGRTRLGYSSRASGNEGR